MIKTPQTVSSNLSELSNLAKELIGYASGNNIIAFFGEMGSGKTTLIRSLCRELGVSENVSSPTFSLINEYHDLKGNKIFHFDFYRIEKEREALDIGCEEYFESGCLCLIEWPEKILNLLPHPFIKINIEIRVQQRIYTFSYD